mgnify:CR=1 FL=1
MAQHKLKEIGAAPAGLPYTGKTLFLAGKQSDYTFASSQDGLTVTVTDIETNDADTITGVEILRFSDNDILVSKDANGLVLTGSSNADNIQVVGGYPVTVKGTGDNDVIGGGDGDDLLFGADGDDTIKGNLGNDTIEGGNDNDTIDGGAGDDTLKGGAGNDVLTGGFGDDTIKGESGANVAVFAGNQSGYAITSQGDGTTIKVKDQTTGDEDTITGVQTLRFDDGELAGNSGPPLIAMKARFPDREVLFNQIWDPTKNNPNTFMPPFGKHGAITKDEINKIIEYLYTL